MTTPPVHAPWRILVVDDEQNLNWSLVTSLRKDGYHADGAPTGEDALRLLSQSSYDCVISDVKMPGMDGFELLQWLRQHQPRTRVIMMTAFGSPSAREEALRGGVIAYLEKPFDLRDIRDELLRLTREREAGAGQPESEGYDLLDVARVISLSRRDVALRVLGGGYSGSLRFLRGDLVWAEAGPLRGEVAFLALCTPRGGQVQPVPWDGRTERNVIAPVSRLIYQALSTREGRPIALSGALTQDPRAATTTWGPPPAGVPSMPPATTPAVMPSEPASPSGGATAGALSTASVQTGRLGTNTQQPDESAREAVRKLARALPGPGGVALVRGDGVIVAQSWSGMREIASGAFTHLAGAAQAAARGLLLADLGTLTDVRIRTGEHALVLRRVTRPDGQLFLVAIVPLASDLDTMAAALVWPAADAPDSADGSDDNEHAGRTDAQV